MFIKSILRSLSYASAKLHLTGPTVVGLWGSSGDVLSCLLLILFLPWSLGIKVCQDYNARC